MRVLVVEDHQVLGAAIGTGLRRESMAVDVVLDGNEALEHLAVTRYDVVVLDRLIDALLTLASSQRGLRKREPFDLAEVTDQIVQARGPGAAGCDVHVDTCLAPARGSRRPGPCESLGVNLVDNAIRHNVPGGL